jgi:hypothetical protein
VFGITEIEALMPVVRPGQIRPRHYSLGFTGLKGEAGGALRLYDGGYGGLSIHLDDSQQLYARSPNFEFADIFPGYAAWQA